MKVSEVIALIGAGYSKAEIDALEAAESGQETPKTETEVKPEAKPETPPAAKPETTPAADANKELLEAIATLTAAVQTRNVRESKQPIEDKPDVKAEADKVLLNLYNN